MPLPFTLALAVEFDEGFGEVPVVGLAVMAGALVFFVPRFEPLLEGITRTLPTRVLFSQLNLVRPGDPVAASKDPRGGAVFLVSRPALLDQIETLIRELDTPALFAEANVLLIPLKNARAPQMASVLQEMIKPGVRGELTSEARELQEQVRRLNIQNDSGEPVLLDLTKPIKILSDSVAGAPSASNHLILTSTTDNLKALAAVVAMMDTVPLMDGVTAKLVHLKNADATTVSQTLNSIFQQGQRLFGGQGGRGPREGRGMRGGLALVSQLNVAVDRRGNTLILSGQEETLAPAENIIAQLDRELETTVTEIKLFRLKYASATRLAPLLLSVFGDSRAVAATDGLRAQVTRLQTSLERKPPKSTEQPRVRAAVVIQADDSTNILIVAARSDTLPLIEDVINTMDIPAASGLSTIRIYPLQHAEAATLQRLIADLYRSPSTQIRREDRPSVGIDERTNALIISAPVDYMRLLEQLISRLDTSSTEVAKIRIFHLKNADARQMVTVLTTLFRLQRTSAQTVNDRSVEYTLVKPNAAQDAEKPSACKAGSRSSLRVVSTRGPADFRELSL